MTNALLLWTNKSAHAPMWLYTLCKQHKNGQWQLNLCVVKQGKNYTGIKQTLLYMLNRTSLMLPTFKSVFMMNLSPVGVS